MSGGPTDSASSHLISSHPITSPLWSESEFYPTSGFRTHCGHPSCSSRGTDRRPGAPSKENTSTKLQRSSMCQCPMFWKSLSKCCYMNASLHASTTRSPSTCQRLKRQLTKRRQNAEFPVDLPPCMEEILQCVTIQFLKSPLPQISEQVIEEPCQCFVDVLSPFGVDVLVPQVSRSFEEHAESRASFQHVDILVAQMLMRQWLGF